MVVHESINVFGGFAPFPNTIMIPTMGLQSDVIGFRFGFGYEKGKRTLRAMSNEQFNNLDEEAEQAIYKHHEATAINFFKQEISTWTALQHTIISKSVEIEKMKAERTPSAMAEIIQTMNTAVAKQGGTVTWDNLAETWNNFFGGGQVFNNYNNVSSTGQPQPTPTPTETNNPPRHPQEPKTPTPPTPPTPPPPEASAAEKAAHASMILAWKNLQSAIAKFKANPKSTFAKNTFLKANTKFNNMMNTHNKAYGHYSHNFIHGLK